MRIGILTFHSQLNYGGVLQCWALQQALTKLGHEVVVIDRWLDEKNRMLKRGFAPMTNRQKIKYWIHLLLGVGDAKWHQRVLRTQAFLRGRLKLTPYHFNDWKDAPKDLGIDCLVVGSDQVWHCGDWGDPRVCLLEGFETSLDGRPRVISYAASFGMRELPRFLGPVQSELGKIESRPLFERGLAKFDAIGCRESEGVEICRGLGFVAEHVVDPTQLLSAADWGTIAKVKHRRQLTCYFLSENVDGALPRLREFSKKMKCEVRVFGYDLPRRQDWLQTPNSPRRAYRWARVMMSRFKHRHVRICEGAGPVEFVKAHAECEWVVTDSFHSLMFATTFGKNVRVLRPQNDERQNMFARMEEFASHANGSLIADGLSAALSSFERGETAAVDQDWLVKRKEDSLAFLAKNLK